MGRVLNGSSSAQIETFTSEEITGVNEDAEKL